MATTVIDINGAYQATLHRLQNMHGNVEVGIFDDGKKEPNKTSVYDVAVYNEYGTSHIPARPFMRQTVDNHEQEWADMAQKLEDRVANGMSVEQALDILGNKAEGHMKETVGQGKFKPNSPKTIKRKGSAQPLIDTGLMRESITYKVNK